MTEKVLYPIISLAEQRYDTLPLQVPSLMVAPTGALSDTLGRPLRDLRISVTDRCNFRCVYCMPKTVFDKDYPYLPHSALLSFEEITRLTEIFIGHGVEKIRLTGGEPLLRKHLEVLFAMLAKLRTHTGQALDLTLTTNGSLLAKKALALKEAGLNRVTVSLDALDEVIFQRMNDVDFPVADVLAGITAAQAVGLGPIKVNMVVKKGMNNDQILPMARYFKGTGIVLRFIEFMDVGASNGWNMTEVMPSHEVIELLQSEFDLAPIAPQHTGETAQRWRHTDGSGEIGVISSVTQAFCKDCNRARLSTEGKLYQCLFATQGYDLRSLLRNETSDLAISNGIAQAWQGRADRYSEIRAAIHDDPTQRAERALRKVEMSYIGG